MPYNLHLPLLPYHRALPLPHVFKICASGSGKRYVYKHVYKKKWAGRNLYNFRWLRLEVTRTRFESLISPHTSYILNSPNPNILISVTAVPTPTELSED